MKKSVVVVLAEGFEEIEAITPVDILRGGGVDVTIAGVASQQVKGAHGILVTADCLLADYDETPDAVVLPGGLPGADNLRNSTDVGELIKRVHKKGNTVAAICASPALVLTQTGVLDGRRATCYPGFEGNFNSSIKIQTDPVVIDGNIITSRGPGTASRFAFVLLARLIGTDKASQLEAGTLFAE